MKLKELERVLKPLRENPYIPAVLALGLILMLLPPGFYTPQSVFFPKEGAPHVG